MSEVLVQAAVRQFKGSLIVGTTNGIARATSRIGRELPTIVENLGQALATRSLPRGKMRGINEGIARSAQKAMVAGYRSRLPIGGSLGGPNRLSGTLGPALGSEGMISGTSDRVISFLNTDLLNQKAKHWYRINYGASGPNLAKAGGSTASTFQVNLNGRPFIVLRDDAPPAVLSWLPKVFEWGPANEMIVWSGPARPLGKGSRAAHFTDLGLEVVAEQFGPAYDLFFREFVQDAKNRARLAKKNINVIADVRLESTGWTVEVH